jgi:hypothetical protein
MAGGPRLPKWHDCEVANIVVPHCSAKWCGDKTGSSVEFWGAVQGAVKMLVVAVPCGHRLGLCAVSITGSQRTAGF